MEMYQIISLVCVIAGIVAFFVLMRPRKYRDPSAADQYTQVRNKLTTREEKKPKPEEEESSGIIGNLIGGIVVVLVGASLIGPISDAVNVATDSITSANESGINFCEGLACDSTFASTLFELIPGFFVIGVIAAALGITFAALRRSEMV